MKASLLLDPDLILCNLESDNLLQAMDDLIILLGNTFDAEMIDRIKDDIRQRLADKKIVAEAGVFFPHIRIANIKKIYFLLGLSPEGIPLSDLGEEKIHIISFFIVPDSSHSSRYLNVLGAFSSVFSDEKNFEELITKENPVDVIQFISSLDVALNDELSVKDIVNYNSPVAKVDDKFEKVLELMTIYGVEILPVINLKGYLVGEINIHTFMKKSFGMYIRSLSAASLCEPRFPFSDIKLEYYGKTVKEVMESNPIFVNINMSFTQIGQLLLKKGTNSIIVTEDSTYLGVITMADLIKVFT